MHGFRHSRPTKSKSKQSNKHAASRDPAQTQGVEVKQGNINRMIVQAQRKTITRKMLNFSLFFEVPSKWLIMLCSNVHSNLTIRPDNIGIPSIRKKYRERDYKVSFVQILPTLFGCERSSHVK
jgi:hypothetical protein